jgi:SAM-dependent methyltransferase
MPKFNILEKAGLPQIKIRSGIRENTPEIKAISNKIDFDYYDGDRKYGFGGYYYDGRWRKVAEVIKERYGLTSESKVLITRDEKGFISFDLMKLIPGIEVYAVHPSKYAINHAMEGYGRWALINCFAKNEDPKILDEKAKAEIMPYLIKLNSIELPFKDDYFDCVIAINDVCDYEESDCRKMIRELVRVTKNNGKKGYIQTDSWLDENGKIKMMDWILICKTYLNVNAWEKIYGEEGYGGDWGFVMFK